MFAIFKSLKRLTLGTLQGNLQLENSLIAV
jgi:hypothetical protein